MKKSNNFIISKNESLSFNSSENLNNINWLEELYDYYNSKEYKDKIKKEVFDILSGKVPEINDNNDISNKSSNTNKFESRNNNNQKFHSLNSPNSNQNSNYFNSNSKDSNIYKNYNNNYYKRQNYRNYNNGKNYEERRGRGRGRYRGRGRGRGRYKNYKKGHYINYNSFYNNNEKNNYDLKENKSNDGKNNKSNNSFIYNLNNNIEKEVDDCDNESENKSNIFESDCFLNSLSDLNLNRLFNGLDLIEDHKGLFNYFCSYNDDFDFEHHQNLSENFLNNLPKTKFGDDNDININPSKCPICLDEYKKGDELTKIPCNHWFHSKCILEWLKQDDICPICNFELNDEEKEKEEEED